MTAVLCLAASGTAQREPSKPATSPQAGAPRIHVLRTFSSEEDLRQQVSLCEWAGEKLKPSPQEQAAVRRKCNHTVNILAGTPRDNEGQLRQPQKIVTDSQGRVIVTDEAASAIHIFDLAHKKRTQIDIGPKEQVHALGGIALDVADNLYVTDPDQGVVVVFDNRGRVRRTLGIANGENLFQRPTGIAIDRRAGHIYVADTPRHFIYELDMWGKTIARFGVRGGGEAAGEFNGPTDLAVSGDKLLVLDANNWRVQVLDLQGRFRLQFPIANTTHAVPPHMGMAVDQAGKVYIANAVADTLRVFDTSGRLLAELGGTGSRPGQFRMPAGLYVDEENRTYVADTFNHRVQILTVTEDRAAEHDQGR